MDVSILGAGTGMVSGAILALVIAFRLQDADLKQAIIDMINKQLAMSSTTNFPILENLDSGFYIVTALVTILLATILCSFGSLVAMIFVNGSNK